MKPTGPRRIKMSPQSAQDARKTLQVPSHDLLHPGINEKPVLGFKKGAFQGRGSKRRQRAPLGSIWEGFGGVLGRVWELLGSILA